MFLHFSNYLYVLYGDPCYGAHEMNLIPTEAAACLVISDKQTPNWYPAFSYQRNASIKLNEGWASDGRQGVEAFVLAQVVDNEAWVVPRVRWRYFDCSALLSCRRPVKTWYSYLSQGLPALDTLLQPIQISSPGSCCALSRRSTVLVLSAMMYCVSASMTLHTINTSSWESRWSITNLIIAL